MNTRYLICAATAILIGGCVTIKDVQRASTLIRLDNELTRLITAQSPAGASEFLDVVFDEAMENATAAGSTADAVSFYRVAATSQWRSANPEAITRMDQAVTGATTVCNALDNPPDRDCLFVRLIIPFAAIEKETAKFDFKKALSNNLFSDEQNTAEAIVLLNNSAKHLQLIKPSMELVFQLGAAEELQGHMQMTEYYCRKATEISGHFIQVASFLLSQTRSFETNAPNADNEPEIDRVGATALLNEIRGLSTISGCESS